MKKREREKTHFTLLKEISSRGIYIQLRLREMTLAPSIPGDDFRSQVKEMRVSTTHGGLTLRTAARGH